MEIIDITVSVTTFFASAGLRIPACSQIDTRDSVNLYVCVLHFESLTRSRTRYIFILIHGFWKQKLTTRLVPSTPDSFLFHPPIPPQRFASCSLCNLFLISANSTQAPRRFLKLEGLAEKLLSSYIFRDFFPDEHFMSTFFKDLLY